MLQILANWRRLSRIDLIVRIRGVHSSISGASNFHSQFFIRLSLDSFEATILIDHGAIFVGCYVCLHIGPGQAPDLTEVAALPFNTVPDNLAIHLVRLDDLIIVYKGFNL